MAQKHYADIGVIIDTSIDFNPGEFDALKELVSNLAGAFNISKKANRLGVLFFSNERWTTIPLNKYFTASDFQKKLQEYQLMNNLDSVEEQLKLVYDMLLGPQSGARINVPKVIIMVTHENALRGINPDALIQSMKPIEKAGIRVVVAAIGKNNHFPSIMNMIKNSSDIYLVPRVADVINVEFAKSVSEKSMDIIGMLYIIPLHNVKRQFQNSRHHGQKFLEYITQLKKGCSKK